LEGIIETIGGTDVLLYYWIDGSLWRADVSGERIELAGLDDPDVQRVVATGEPAEIQQDPSKTLTRGSGVTTAWDWVLPLIVSGETIGVLKLENLQIGTRKMRPFLHNFFNYAAAVLKNDILGETQLRHAYEELKQVNDSLAVAIDASQAANRAKTVFLANMSHELRTPLNAILGFAQLLDRESSLDDQQRRKLLAIQRSGEHLLELINDVLELSRIEAGRLTSHEGVFDLRNLVDSAVEMMQVRAWSKGLAIVSDYPADAPTHFTGDEAHLRQVLLNLLSNAVKYSERGEIRLVLAWDGQLIQFEVIDCGQGISDEDQHKIFDPFYQTSAGVARGDGTGLGLSISRDFVRLMGGELGVESSLGIGSRFFFAIPLLPAVSEPVKPKLRSTELVIGLAPGQPNLKVLIADDDPDNRRVLGEFLGKLGFQVRQVSNGKEAVRVFREDRPHFIWMDMHMPEMGGMEAARIIRAESAGGLPEIAMLTATAFETDQQEVPLGDGEELVRKPFRIEQVLEVMQRRLGLSYRYSEERPGSAQGPGADHRLDPEALRAVSPELLASLRRGAEILDIETVREVARQVTAQDPRLAQVLLKLADDYEFDKILAALPAATSEQALSS
jgi:signal transduction histidine kinase/CheY-like chemotaxis protein